MGWLLPLYCFYGFGGLPKGEIMIDEFIILFFGLLLILTVSFISLLYIIERHNDKDGKK